MKSHDHMIIFVDVVV